ncbi:MAG: nucleoside kinase [Kiritimatiellae bacterium]|nr:nucleoside kinase [Kiritimatiellia bacterium]NLD89996.1 nucleoside kinase [Lentisphaerota bacterium]HQN80864.1 nucleoside kinase [Kiritimatiellia bacterium]
MKKTIVITLENNRKVPCPSQTLAGELLEGTADPASGLPYLGALVNNELVTFAYTLDIDSTVRFVTMAHPGGMQIYVRSLSFLLAKAVKDLHPAARFSVEHALGPGLYCEFESDGVRGITPEQAAKLEAHMRDLVAADRPILRQRMSYIAALDQFTRNGQEDKVSLLRFTNTPKIVTYVCENFSDLATGPMTRSTGPLQFFRLIPYQTGFVLQMPTCDSAPVIPEFKPIKVLTETFKEYNRWGRILGVNTVGRLNEIIAANEIHDFIKVAEALHEKKIAAIADQIASNDAIKWILIAGPSSSGKTTFAKRLAIQLRVNGLRPVTLGTDDYFVDREHTPRTPSGDYDFEHLEAVDVPVLNRDLADLDAGREIQLPTFDFHTGSRIHNGKTLQLAEDQVVILEGIHSLNPALTPGLPDARKFLIYISALTQLNLDNNNRIPTTDNRLIRRLVRDHRYRGHSATRTLEMWPNVGRGERTWIFPFQEEADAVFNSALDYELAILSVLARPLLSEIKPNQVIYAEARRMMEFLSHFLPLSADLPPPVSIIREFVGGSDFDY